MAIAAARGDAGFHDGELTAQRRAGVPAEAARLSRMVEPAALDGGIAGFLADRTFGALTGRDASGRLWISPLAGRAGFLRVTSPTSLAVFISIPPGDPLYALPAGQQVGMIVTEFASRRRVRINGILSRSGNDGLVIEVEQAFGNCPQYIQQRILSPAPGSQADTGGVRSAAALSVQDIDQIRAADTFFLGTTYPRRGSDASHKGGAPGFVRVDGGQLWWPDYPGNNMFNSFGNIAVNPEAALLFPDFMTGRTLQLSGPAQVEWDEPGGHGDDGRTGRRVRFIPQQVVAGHLLAMRQVAHQPYRRNPPVND
jgi:hypothetical protein